MGVWGTIGGALKGAAKGIAGSGVLKGGLLGGALGGLTRERNEDFGGKDMGGTRNPMIMTATDTNAGRRGTSKEVSRKYPRGRSMSGRR